MRSEKQRRRMGDQALKVWAKIAQMPVMEGEYLMREYHQLSGFLTALKWVNGEAGLDLRWIKKEVGYQETLTRRIEKKEARRAKV